MRAPRWQFFVGAGIAAVLLWASLRGVDYGEIAESLAHANYGLLLVSCLLTLAAFYVRAVRWGVLLRTVKDIPNGSLFSATMIGFAANNLLPARIGEFVRAWAIGKRENISRSAAFATVVVERVVDIFSLLLFFGVALLLHPFPEEARRGGYLALALNVLLLVLLFVAERNPERVSGMGTWIAERTPKRFRSKLLSLVNNFVVGLGVLRNATAVIPLILYSLLLYGVTILGIHTCLMAFDFAVPWYTSLVLLVMLTLGIILAPTPGYVGSIQIASVWTLSLFGVSRGDAFSFSIFYHVSQYLPITAVGLWFLARQGLSLGEVAGAAGKEVKETA